MTLFTEALSVYPFQPMPTACKDSMESILGALPNISTGFMPLKSLIGSQ